MSEADWLRDQEEDDLEQIAAHRFGRCDFYRCPICIAESCPCEDCQESVLDEEPPE